MADDKQTKTEQRYKDEVSDTPSACTTPHAAPDAIDDPKKKAEAGKTTHRTE